MARLQLVMYFPRALGLGPCSVFGRLGEFGAIAMLLVACASDNGTAFRNTENGSGGSTVSAGVGAPASGGTNTGVTMNTAGATNGGSAGVGASTSAGANSNVTMNTAGATSSGSAGAGTTSGGASMGGSMSTGGAKTGGSSTLGGSSSGDGSGGSAGASASGSGAGGAASGGSAPSPIGGGGTTSSAGGASGGMSATGGSSTTTGCGSSTWPESDRYSIDVAGMTREYILDVPSDYDPNRPYRLIFAWHWLTASADSVASGGFGGSYYGLLSRADSSAIFVAPDGIDNGWANTGGRDIAFLREMLARLEGELCVDENRVFSVGWSYGGMMSLAVGCAMGDVFRAIAPMSGALYSGCEAGDHPVAFWGSHGDADTTVPIANGRAARNEFVSRNGCDMTTTPVEPSGCVSYQGCEAGYPVTWCEFSGGHMTPSFAGDALWDFFSQF